MILFIVFIPGLYYIYLFNPLQINHYLPKTIIIVSLFIIFFTILIVTIGINDKNNNFVNLELIKLNYKKYFKLFALFFSFFVVFYLLYYVSSYILYYSTNRSLSLTIVIIILLLGIIYNKYIKELYEDDNEDESYGIKKIIIDIIFYIPCIVINIINFIIKDFKNTPSSTFIMLYIIIAMVLFYYIIPFLRDLTRDRKEIILLDNPKPLTNMVVQLNNKELNDKIIKSRPFVEKTLLEKNMELKKQLDYFTKINKDYDLISSINQYENRRILYDSPNKEITIKEIPDCYNKEISCINDNLYCINKKNKNDKIRIKNIYNMYEKCKTHESGSLFSNLFRDPKDKIKFYNSASKDNQTTLKKWCQSEHEGKNVAVTCLRFNNDMKNNTIVDTKYSNENLLNKEIYACSLLDKSLDDTNQKYNIIRGYNDIYNNAVTFDCDNNVVESFNSDIHALDNHLNDVDLYLSLSKSEQEILNTTLNDGNSILQNQLAKISNIKDKNTLLLEYISNHGGKENSIFSNYNKLIEKINEFNTKKNEFIEQESSALIQMINHTNKIYNYNYHYGISFWIYFDSSIIKDKSQSDIGFIMNYSNNPSIYFDYNTEELVIEIEDCSKNILMDETNECVIIPIYKTKDIIYQKWNHVVINYNYGTLDIFINNNLVATQKNVSPYIKQDENILQFGSNDTPLEYCGICNISYYEKPLNLIDIKKIYKKRKNPCK